MMETMLEKSTFTFIEARGLSLRQRVQLAISVLLTPLTLILIGHSIRVPNSPSQTAEVDSAAITTVADVSKMFNKPDDK